MVSCMSEKKDTIKEGDFILVDYTGYVKDSGEIIDTTIEEEAKNAGIYNPQNRYGPQLVVVGRKWVVEGLDESFIGKSVGDEYEIDIPPEKGFGVRDSKKIQVVTVRRLRERGVKDTLSPGTIIEYEGKPAIIRAVVSGRVMLDFNPPLAGKHLHFKVKIIKKLKNLNDKITELIKHVDPDFINHAKISIRNNQKHVVISLGNATIDNPRLHLSKKSIAEHILDLIDTVELVRFVEEVKREGEETKQDQQKS